MWVEVDVIAAHYWHSVRNDGGRYSGVDTEKVEIMVRILKDMLKVNLAMTRWFWDYAFFLFSILRRKKSSLSFSSNSSEIDFTRDSYLGI